MTKEPDKLNELRARLITAGFLGNGSLPMQSLVQPQRNWALSAEQSSTPAECCINYERLLRGSGNAASDITAKVRYGPNLSE
ncbi:MAG: hypothetical protein AAF340_13080 [Pseudomonadota bacterium]